ncbi:hypothetical protein SAMN05660420_01642 [Desulfuromusa kysingii]|uniref:Uncharacterized protein n=1 Tax=Desulfuromusa kysingii TaxID=37625 RepID=A0A1H3ZRB7_9BACT|nr:hypothetical protein [Desulfuromusa kysingii]SEA26198.1 hypothetical protein SAMN05660420_01642 [Desulfuromusa kysingii]
MENHIKVSSHINQQIVYFGTYFHTNTMSRKECLALAEHSSSLHCDLVDSGDLAYYEKHISLAKQVYQLMCQKLNNPQLINDILFCGASDRTWEDTGALLSELYGITMHSREISAFYYLHEINEMLYIDAPLPARDSISA